MPGETISPEHAASLVKSGMWLDYGATLCEPDVFDKALAARKDELENVKIRTCLGMRPRARDRRGILKRKHFHLFQLAFFALRAQKARRRPLQLHAPQSGRSAGLLPALS